MNFRKHKLAIAVASSTLLMACGGGENAADIKSSTLNQASQAEVNEKEPDDEPIALTDNTLELRDEAEREGIERKVYVLSQEKGAYGKILEEDGWETASVEPSKIPKNAETIVYVNASDETSASEEVLAFLKNFKGVIVIDSDEVVSAGVDKEHIVDDPAPQLQDESITEGKRSQSAEFYLLLADGTAKYVPSATALVTSSISQSIMPVSVQEDGGLNGSRPSARQTLIDLTIVALDNLKQSKSKKEGEEGTQVSGKGFNSAPSTWDRVVDLNYAADNWNVIGRAFVEAFKEGSGSRHFVAVEIQTGTNNAACFVSGKECGIYPQSKSHIIRTERPSTTRWKTISYATQYSARASVYPATQVMEYRPSKTSWTATEAVDTDSYEKVWSEGFSVGASAGVSSSNALSLGASGAYSKSTTHRRRMHRWDGDGGIASESWSSGGTTWKKHTAYSGVKIKSDYRWDFVGVKAGSWANTGETGFEAAMRESQLRALYCYGTGKTWDARQKPKMSYEGWNPSLAAMFEVPASRVRASTNNTINVSVGFRLGRQIRDYEAVSNQNCFRSPGSVGYRSYSGYRLVGQSGVNGDLMNYSTAWREYNRNLILSISPSSFTN